MHRFRCGRRTGVHGQEFLMQTSMPYGYSGDKRSCIEACKKPIATVRILCANGSNWWKARSVSRADLLRERYHCRSFDQEPWPSTIAQPCQQSSGPHWTSTVQHQTQVAPLKKRNMELAQARICQRFHARELGQCLDWKTSGAVGVSARARPQFTITAT